MNMKILKYKIELINNPIIKMPHEFKILHIDNQCGKLFIWAEVNEDSYPDDIHFRIYGTETLLDADHDKYTYISTILDSRGLIWHVYKM